ncbi:NUDIX domain-containing protein [Jatrophihabitans telluris]|uniref:NUDIX domain-containing protein n=1 Tax=Jatrophihabitans telluris TaxID=2038343 RepID=A0ABY4R2F9_9ACTN|nr:NUDIX domain-containing protein [Jatrophihabitans telluris]UQX90005.1 NUDIX domain-containing protein [Jatrophihabitans telluris]
MAEYRVAGRVVLLDAADRVLLVHERTDLNAVTSHWLTPGGGLHAGETPAAAAVRELAEELGLKVDLPDEKAADFVDRYQYHLAGRDIDQTNHFYVVRTAEPLKGGVVHRTELEEELILGERWWSVDELAATNEVLRPDTLPDRVAEAVGLRPAPTVRQAGRVLVLDRTGHVLLLRHRCGPGLIDTVWAAPGGGCEPGESALAAAMRELSEECGFRLAVADPEPVAVERRMWATGGIAYDQTDNFYLARVAERPEVDPSARTTLEAQTVLEHRWLSVEDLDTGRDRFEPANLPAIMRGLQ